MVSNLVTDSSELLSPFSVALDSFRDAARLRSIPAEMPDGCIDMTTNDYLGLASMLSGRCEPMELKYMTASASRLLAAHQQDALALEARLSALYGRAALLFNSGYHANTGCVSALAGGGKMTIVADKLVHASIIDGIRLSGCVCRRFRHNDTAQLEKILRREEEAGNRVLLVTESLFSMDGDIAPLRDIVEIKKKFDNILLYVDEAHAFGTRGPKGLGICAELGILDSVDIIVGTFGKACASAGAFVATSPLLRDYLVNTARSLIFSTSLPPACFRHTSAMLDIITGEEGEKLRTRLRENSDRFRAGIEEITGSSSPSASQIVPLVLGDASAVVSLSQHLRERHRILALPIRRPTVPEGTERIRFAMNALLPAEQIEYILSALRKEL